MGGAGAADNQGKEANQPAGAPNEDAIATAATGRVRPGPVGTASPRLAAKVSNHCDECSKEACEYAVGLSEKFLTLAAGGIAFIIGLVFAKADSPAVQLSPSVLRGGLVLFGLSVFLGWLFLMNVVGSVADCDYRVKNNAKQWLCLLQIIAALVGIGLLAYCTFTAIGEPVIKRSLCRLDNKAFSVSCDWA